MISNLSIIFPIFNEEKRLPNTFKEIIKFKKNFKKRKLEVIFVDDGSNDKSHQLINNFTNQENSKNLKLKKIILNKNMGKGKALKKGVKESTMSWILTTDVDLSVPLNQVLKWDKKQLIKNNSIVFGSRNLNKSVVIKKRYRFLLGKILNLLTKYILNIRLNDSQCGYKLYKKKPAKEIFSRMTNDGFAHDLEIVLISKKQKLFIQELPVKWTHKDGSKLNIFYDPLKMFLSIISLRIKYF